MTFIIVIFLEDASTFFIFYDCTVTIIRSILLFLFILYLLRSTGAAHIVTLTWKCDTLVTVRKVKQGREC